MCCSLLNGKYCNRRHLVVPCCDFMFTLLEIFGFMFECVKPCAKLSFFFCVTMRNHELMSLDFFTSECNELLILGYGF